MKTAMTATKEYILRVYYENNNIVSFNAIGTLCQAVEFAEALDCEAIEISENGKSIVTIDRRG